MDTGRPEDTDWEGGSASQRLAGLCCSGKRSVRSCTCKVFSHSKNISRRWLASLTELCVAGGVGSIIALYCCFVYHFLFLPGSWMDERNWAGVVGVNSPPSPLTPIVKINKIGIKKYMSIYRTSILRERSTLVGILAEPHSFTGTSGSCGTICIWSSMLQGELFGVRTCIMGTSYTLFPCVISTTQPINANSNSAYVLGQLCM